MAPSVNQPTEQAHRRVQQNNAATWCNYALELQQRVSREFQMVPHIEKYEIAYCVVIETEIVSRLDSVQPWIRKNIRSNARWKILLGYPDAGTQFNSKTGNSLRGDCLVEICVGPSQRWFAIPEFTVFAYFLIVLLKFRHFWINIWLEQSVAYSAILLCRE